MSRVKLIAQFITWLSLPFLMPILGLIITFYTPSDTVSLNQINMADVESEHKELILNVFFVIAAIAPSISFYSLKKGGFISSIDMEERAERGFPILIMMIYCIVLVAFFKIKDTTGILPSEIVSLPLSGAIIAGVFFIINRFFKVSLHAAGMGILVGYLIAFNTNHILMDPYFVILAVLFSGLVCSARLILNKHSLKEVFFGWVIALFISFLTNHFYDDYQNYFF